MNGLQQQLRQILSEFPGFSLAILFGSQAAGNADAESDIDLALLSRAPLDSGLKIALTERISTRLGCPVDIVDLYHAEEPILGQVFKGTRLLGDDATYARLLTRHLLNTADFVPLRQRILAERRNAWIK
jgi:predicted nucleotidyltransferase